MNWLAFRTPRVCLYLCLGLLAGPGLNSAQSREPREALQAALAQIPRPASWCDFASVPHLPGMNQGRTSICWSFATCSFVESEMARLQRPAVRLSVMYPVYCQYVEKARRFVQTKGQSRFNPGDLFTGVIGTCRQYGALPSAVYDQRVETQLPNQRRLDARLLQLMQEVKRQGQWDEALVLPRVKAILNHYLGEPPATFTFQGRSYTPQSFRDEVVALPWNDYRMFTSFEWASFGTFTDFRVPDNWQHHSNYFNLALADFYRTFKTAVQAGYSVTVSVDDTEPTYAVAGRYAFIPERDVPAGQLTQAAREARYRDGRTTDDHAIHIIGYRHVGGEDWFLAKDSWKSAWQDGNQGYLFLHSSYVKLKILAFIVHRDGVNPALGAAN